MRAAGMSLHEKRADGSAKQTARDNAHHGGRDGERRRPGHTGLLKERRTEVLRAVKDLLLSDLHLAEEEEDVLSQIALLLG